MHISYIFTRKALSRISSLAVGAAVLASPAMVSADFLGTLKDGAAQTGQAVGNAVSSGAETVTDLATPDRSREEIDQMAAAALQELFAANENAKALLDASYGYAVFDTRKMSFMITTGFGAGVAVDRDSDERTYMKMATGGVNVGLGAQWYKVIFLFETESKFRDFVVNGWDAGAGGSAAVWDEGATVSGTFKNGLAVYQLTDKGLMLAADLTGTKYWKDEELNRN